MLAAVYGHAGPLREQLTGERARFERLAGLVYRAPERRGGDVMFPLLPAGSPAVDSALPAFVVARDGVYLRKRTLLGASQTRADRVDHLPSATESLDYALPPVPADVAARAVGFFRAVYRARRTEAAVLLLWRAGSFDLAVPAQKVTAASVRFDVSGADIPAGARLVGTVHSHGGFGAFASSTDEDDEAGLDGLHVVVGNLDRRRPAYSAAVVVDGVRFRLPVERLIRRPRRLVEPPARWLERVSGRAAAPADGEGHLVDRARRAVLPPDGPARPQPARARRAPQRASAPRTPRLPPHATLVPVHRAGGAGGDGA